MSGRKLLPWGVLEVALVSLTGCAGKNAGFSEVNSAATDRTGYEAAWTRTAEDNARVAALTRQLLKDELKLESAVQVALLNNRHLQATFEQLGISRGLLIQAGVPDNPVFAADFRFFSAGTVVEGILRQDFISLLLIPLRRRVQGHEFEATKRLVTRQIVHLVGDLKRAYYAYQASKQLVEMLGQVVQASEASYLTSARLREAGNIRQLDVLRERALYEEAKVQRNAAIEQRVRTREQLNALMGVWGPNTRWETPARLADVPPSERPAATSAEASTTSPAPGIPAVAEEEVPTKMPGPQTTALGPAEPRDERRAERLAGGPTDETISAPAAEIHGRREAAGPDAEAAALAAGQEPSAERFAQVERMAVTRSLDLSASRQLIEAQASRVKLHTIREIFPFLNAGVTGEREAQSGEWGFGPGIRVPVPLWDFAQGTRPAEVSRLRQHLERYAALAIDIRATARVAEAQLQTARSRAVYFRDVIMPLHAGVVAEAQLQYNAMQITPFELLLAKRAQITAGAAYVLALLEYWVARSQLEQLLDGSLPPALAPHGGAMAPSMAPIMMPGMLQGAQRMQGGQDGRW